MVVEGALTHPCPGFAVGKLAMVVVRVQGPSHDDNLALTTISLLIHGADRDGAPASVTSPRILPLSLRRLLLTTYRPGQDDCSHNAVYLLTHSLLEMYHFFLGLLENPACVLNFPCLFSSVRSRALKLKGPPPSDVVLEAVAYRDVIPTPSRLSHSSPIHLLASQLSSIALLSHLSSLAFGFFSQDRLQTCGMVCPRSPPLSLTYLPWILSLISVAHPFPPFPSSVLCTLPLGLTLRNLNCLPALPSTFMHMLHRHLFPSPGGLSSSRISSFVLGTIAS
jgi:hypothetical protein